MSDKLERMAEALDNVSIRDDDDYCANNDVVSAAVEALRTLSAVLAKVEGAMAELSSKYDRHFIDGSVGMIDGSDVVAIRAALAELKEVRNG